jgi:outer membrane lipoprotein-sorting protein
LNSRYHRIVTLFVLLGLISFGKALPSDTLSTVIEGIRARYGNAEGLAAAYTRESISKTMAMLGETERHDLARGRLYFKPPDFLRLEQNSPQEELLLTDGQTLWWYLPLEKEAYQYPTGQFGQELRVLGDILRGLKDTEDSFHISLRVAPETNAYHLILKPEPPWEEIDHLEVIVLKGDFAIEQVDIYNNIGGLTRFLLTDWKEKDRFGEEFFSFSPPPGVKVLEK